MGNYLVCKTHVLISNEYKNYTNIVIVLISVTVEIIPHGQSSNLLNFNNEKLNFPDKKTSQTAHLGKVS